MPSAHDDRDRKEATRLLLAAAVALILLVAIVWGGLYYLFITSSKPRIFLTRSRQGLVSRTRR